MFIEIGFFKYWFFVEILSVVYMIFVLKYIGNIFYWLYINFRIFLEKKSYWVFNSLCFVYIF